MIITRTPFRLSFAGGGSDLPGFFQEEEGAVLSTALNKYMYITVNRRFDETFRLSYSKTEIKESVNSIEHPIFREALKSFSPKGGLEIISMADIPSGTGLGSSSSFTVGLLNALNSFDGKFQSADELAAKACQIEIDILKEPIGKQDQYIAAFGGLQFIRFQPSGKVFVDPVVCHDETLKKLEACTKLYFTGKTRDARTILKDQSESISSTRETVREMVKIAYEMREILQANPRSLEGFGQLLHGAWELKKSISNTISNTNIDEWYDRAMEAGAWGGKLLGAGGGGFLMIFADPDKMKRIDNELRELKPFEVNFEPQGSKVIFVG